VGLLKEEKGRVFICGDCRSSQESPKTQATYLSPGNKKGEGLTLKKEGRKRRTASVKIFKPSSKKAKLKVRKEGSWR